MKADKHEEDKILGTELKARLCRCISMMNVQRRLRMRRLQQRTEMDGSMTAVQCTAVACLPHSQLLPPSYTSRCPTPFLLDEMYHINGVDSSPSATDLNISLSNTYSCSSSSLAHITITTSC